MNWLTEELKHFNTIFASKVVTGQKSYVYEIYGLQLVFLCTHTNDCILKSNPAADIGSILGPRFTHLRVYNGATNTYFSKPVLRTSAGT